MAGTIWFTFRGRKWTTPRRWGGGPPDDGGGDDGEAREEEGGETDEDTISITNSSTPGEPGRGNGAEGSSGGGGPPEDPDNFPEGGVGPPRRGPHGHRGQRGRTGPAGRDGLPGPLGPVGPMGPVGTERNIREIWSPTRLPPLLYTSNRDYPIPYECKSKHYWNGEFLSVLRRIAPTFGTISAKCESKHGRSLVRYSQITMKAEGSFRSVG